ncbi:MAG: type II toxin-antitoxin system VapC family toxin [Planctomycetes bacterium]|nr:type II toxin-antitoxin system VapC family toxin [Planctomycetota bacterium]
MPSTVLVDSGPLIALFDRDDHHHRRALKWMRANQAALATNTAVLTEVCHLLAAGGIPAGDFLGWAEQALDIDDRTGGDLPRIRAILAAYHDLPADFADASLVALAERRSCFTVATVDRDFTVYRSATRRHFRNVFPLT